VPFIVMYSLLIAGVFLLSFSVADEREKHTLEALLVTPVRLSEIVLAKALLGFVLAIAMAIVTLWLNGALAVQALALSVVLGVAGVLLAEIGLVYGAASKNVTGGLRAHQGHRVGAAGADRLLHLPELAAVDRQDLPDVLGDQPVYEVTISGAGLDAVWAQLAIAVIAAMILPITVLPRRLENPLAVSG
jgi:ABC-type Na+ efflux pump permease subunit